MKRHRTQAEKVATMTALANQTRDSADEMARLYGGCDDPLHPWTVATPKPYSNWIEFTEQVCVPIAAADDARAVQEAMRWYRMECPSYIAAALVFALNRVQAGQKLIADLRALHQKSRTPAEMIFDSANHRHVCLACAIDYPCPTIRLIDAAEERA